MNPTISCTWKTENRSLSAAGEDALPGTLCRHWRCFGERSVMPTYPPDLLVHKPVKLAAKRETGED